MRWAAALGVIYLDEVYPQIVGLVAKLQGTLIPTISYSLRRWKIESVHKVMSDFSRQAVSFLGFVQTPF